MEHPNAVEYFLGANSPGGFYSLYDQLLPSERAQRIYILKGGPGCGKSTLMRRVAQRVEEAGIGAERILIMRPGLIPGSYLFQWFYNKER